MAYQNADGSINAVVLSGPVLTGVNATQSNANVATPINGSNVNIKATPGRLFQVTITTVGTGPMNFSDNGVVVFTLSAAQTAVLTSYPCNVQFSTAIVAVGNATNPAIISAIA